MPRGAVTGSGFASAHPRTENSRRSSHRHSRAAATAAAPAERPVDSFEPASPARLDGSLIGADGVPRDRRTPFRDIEPLCPRGGGKKRAIFVNGVLNTPETLLETM